MVDMELYKAAEHQGTIDCKAWPELKSGSLRPKVILRQRYDEDNSLVLV